MDANAKLFEMTFLKQCKELTNNDLEVLQILRKRFSRANDEYIATDEFRHLIHSTISQMKKDGRNTYVYLKEFSAELKAYAKKKASKDASPMSERCGSDSEGIARETASKSCKRPPESECKSAPEAKRQRATKSVLDHQSSKKHETSSTSVKSKHKEHESCGGNEKKHVKETSTDTKSSKKHETGLMSVKNKDREHESSGGHERKHVKETSTDTKSSKKHRTEHVKETCTDTKSGKKHRTEHVKETSTDTKSSKKHGTGEISPKKHTESEDSIIKMNGKRVETEHVSDSESSRKSDHHCKEQSPKKVVPTVIIKRMPLYVVQRKIVPVAMKDEDVQTDNPAFQNGEVSEQGEGEDTADDEKEETGKSGSDQEEAKEEEEEEEEEDEKDRESARRKKKRDKKKKSTQDQIRRLEGLLGEIDHQIKKIQAKELSLDDLESTDSSYLLEDRYKKKFVKVWEKLCELKKRVPSTGRITERKFRFEGTRYPEINTKIERFVNKRKEFPDFRDVFDIVRHCNSKHNLHLNRKKCESIARDAFTCIGNSLQKRRMDDFQENFGSHLTDTYRMYDDPALYDRELRRKLEKNKEDGKTRIEAVINKYVRKQEADGDETDESDDEEDEEEENAEKENEKNVVEEVEREIREKATSSEQVDAKDTVKTGDEAAASGSSDQKSIQEVLEIESSDDDEEAEPDSGGEDSDLIIEDDDIDETEAKKPCIFPSDAHDLPSLVASVKAGGNQSSAVNDDGTESPAAIKIKEEPEEAVPSFMQALGLTVQKSSADVKPEPVQTETSSATVQSTSTQVTTAAASEAAPSSTMQVKTEATSETVPVKTDPPKSETACKTVPSSTAPLKGETVGKTVPSVSAQSRDESSTKTVPSASAPVKTEPATTTVPSTCAQSNPEIVTSTAPKTVAATVPPITTQQKNETTSRTVQSVISQQKTAPKEVKSSKGSFLSAFALTADKDQAHRAVKEQSNSTPKGVTDLPIQTGSDLLKSFASQVEKEKSASSVNNGVGKGLITGPVIGTVSILADKLPDLRPPRKRKRSSAMPPMQIPSDCVVVDLDEGETSQPAAPPSGDSGIKAMDNVERSSPLKGQTDCIVVDLDNDESKQPSRPQKDDDDSEPPVKVTKPPPVNCQTDCVVLDLDGSESSQPKKDDDSEPPVKVTKPPPVNCQTDCVVLDLDGGESSQALSSVKDSRDAEPKARSSESPTVKCQSDCVVVDLDDGESDQQSTHRKRNSGSKSTVAAAESPPKKCQTSPSAKSPPKSVRVSHRKLSDDCKIIAELDPLPSSSSKQRDAVSEPANSCSSDGNTPRSSTVDKSSRTKPVHLSDELIASLKKGSQVKNSEMASKEAIQINTASANPEVRLSDDLLASLSANRVPSPDVNLSNELLAALAKSKQSSCTSHASKPTPLVIDGPSAEQNNALPKSKPPLKDDVTNEPSSMVNEALTIELCDSPVPSEVVGQENNTIDCGVIGINSDIRIDPNLIVNGNHSLVAGATLLSVEKITPVDKTVPPAVAQPVPTEPTTVSLHQEEAQSDEICVSSVNSTTLPALTQSSENASQDSVCELAITCVTTVYTPEQPEKHSSHEDEMNLPETEPTTETVVQQNDSSVVSIEEQPAVGEDSDVLVDMTNADVEEQGFPGFLISDTGQVVSGGMAGEVRLVSVEPIHKSKPVAAPVTPMTSSTSVSSVVDVVTKSTSDVVQTVESLEKPAVAGTGPATACFPTDTTEDAGSGSVSESVCTVEPALPDSNSDPPQKENSDSANEIETLSSLTDSGDKLETNPEEEISGTPELFSDDSDNDSDNSSSSCQMSPRVRRKHGGLQPTGEILARLKERQKLLTEAIQDNGEESLPNSGPSVVIDVDKSDDEDDSILIESTSETGAEHNKPSGGASFGTSLSALKLRSPVKRIAKDLVRSVMSQNTRNTLHSANGSTSGSLTVTKSSSGTGHRSPKSVNVRQSPKPSASYSSPRPASAPRPTVQSSASHRSSQPGAGRQPSQPVNTRPSPRSVVNTGSPRTQSVPNYGSPRGPLMGLLPRPTLNRQQFSQLTRATTPNRSTPTRPRMVNTNVNMSLQSFQNRPVGNVRTNMSPNFQQNKQAVDVQRMANLLLLAGSGNRSQSLPLNGMRPAATNLPKQSSPSRSRRLSLNRRQQSSKSSSGPAAMSASPRSNNDSIKISSYQSLSTGLQVRNPQGSQTGRQSPARVRSQQKQAKDRTDKAPLIVLSDSE